MTIPRLVLLLLFVSCSAPSGQCVKQTDCAADQVCSETGGNVCTRRCDGDADCASEGPRSFCRKFVGPNDPDGGVVAGYSCAVR
jgi:hypothetical protein